MKRKYVLSKGNKKRITRDFTYAISHFVKERKTFTFEKDCIHNQTSTVETYGFEYVSMITRKKFSCGTKVQTECSFEKIGAPLIVFTNEINDCVYGVHFEVVAWENGCNVWWILPSFEKEPRLIGQLSFPIIEKSKIELGVEFFKKEIEISINGRKFNVLHPDFPEEFYVGITACEGLNYFYSFVIEDGK